MPVKWKGKGVKEKALDIKGNVIIEISKNLFRPLDVVYLLGDSSKAKKKLGWKPKKNINSLIEDMVNFEIKNLND
jgi:GDPmannose 4,6-dehydratase